MPRRALAPCSMPGCPTLTDRGRCTEHERAADAARGNATQRGYTGRGHLRFRRLVLRRDRICVMCRRARATHADHYPLGRRELVAQGLDPDDPQHGRGLCSTCDSFQTAQRQPGGWNNRY